jgi:hypothetical protein
MTKTKAKYLLITLALLLPTMAMAYPSAPVPPAFYPNTVGLWGYNPTTGLLYPLQCDANGLLQTAGGGGGGGSVTQGSIPWLSQISDGTHAATIDASAPTGTEYGLTVRTIPRKLGPTTPETTATLAANSVYTGSWKDTNADGVVNVFAQSYSDQASAASGFVIQGSNDTTNSSLTYTIASTTAAAATLTNLYFTVPSRYWRVVYTNGGTNQAAFEISHTSSQVATTPVSISGNSAVSVTPVPVWNTANISLAAATWTQIRGPSTAGHYLSYLNLSAYQVYLTATTTNSAPTGTPSATTNSTPGVLGIAYPAWQWDTPPPGCIGGYWWAYCASAATGTEVDY